MKIETAKFQALNLVRLSSVIGFFAAIVIIFFVLPVFEKNYFTHLIFQSSFAGLILSTVYTLEGKPWSLGLFFLIPFICVDSLSYYYHSLPYLITSHIISAIFTSFAILILLQKIFNARHTNVKLIFCALKIYLLSGLLWTDFYFIENTLSPGSFQGVMPILLEGTIFPDIYEQHFNLLYYSFATLATLGMGDITPIHHLAKSLTAIEAIFGQLFVAIIIAKLVSVWWILPEKQQS